METRETTTAAIQQAHRDLFCEGDVVELRAIGDYATHSGYFDDSTRLAEEAAKLDRQGFEVYRTINPVNPDLLSRCHNRTKKSGRRSVLTTDGQIARRRYIGIDVDPERPAGVSSSDEEKAAAHERARAVAAYLKGQGWATPYFADSGNGYHLLYPTDLPNDEASRDLVQRCLEALDLRFSDEEVKIDTSVFNAARIFKVYGTKAKKGDSTDARPHRTSELVYTPDERAPIDEATLEKLAAQAPCEPSRPHHPNGAGRFDIDRFIAEAGFEIGQTRPFKGTGRKWELKICPWNPDHTDGSAYILEFPSGALAAGCLHNSCQGLGWADLRGRYDPKRPSESNRQREPETTPAEAEKKRSEKRDPPTHDELRDRWIKQHPVYSYGLGEWRKYTNGIWPRTSETMIKQTVAEVVEAAKPEGIRPTAPLLSSVSEMARIKVYVEDELWDSDPDILVCKNGVLHIPTGELREHKPSYYATSGVPYDYDPEAYAAVWDLFLNTTVPDAADFLQEFAGYSLTIDTSHEIALWLAGPRGSGRSTLLGGLAAMLGPRAGVLGLADVERNRFSLANLPGKTLVTATEQPSSYVSCAHILNAVISGEPIQVERKYHDAYEIVPRAKIAWAMNELPRVSETTSGLFRRVKVVKFPELAEQDRNPDIKREIAGEGAGILNWALEGLRRLRKRGHFDIPECVRDATAEFEESNDVPGLFVEDACERDPNARVQASKLYKEYRWWCEEHGHKPMSSTRVAADWQRLGFKKTKTGGVLYYHGLSVGRNDV